MADVDPREVLNEARELARAGRYAEAPEKHVWFHDHALAIEPAMAGVRLSFALSDWVRLGEVYPPARQALVAVRDRKAAAVRAGDRSSQLLPDVAAINRELGEAGETGDLFLAAHAADPGWAARFYDLAEPGLVARGEYGACGAYVRDAGARLRKIIDRRRYMIGHAADIPPEYAAGLKETVERRFAGDVGRLIEILAAVGREAEAERVREAATAETESDEAREAIRQSGRS